MPAPATGKRKRDSADDKPSISSNKTTSSASTIQIVVGTYERVLHGFTASIPLTQGSSQEPNGTAASKSSADEQEEATSESDTVKANYASLSENPDIPNEQIADHKPQVNFRDTFLLTAHSSSIRCLAFSPPSSGRRYLATGSSDETIKIYQISSVAPHSITTRTATTPKRAAPVSTSKLNGTRIPAVVSDAANPSATNRELGTLTPHTSTITSLRFPTHSKLVSTSLDNSISISRTRDWTHLTTLRAPQPKSGTSTSITSKPSQNYARSVLRRPKGDTYALGSSPSGINAVSVHPSQRLAISVGLGERCMRLWNLVTGRKAGVLVFDKGVFGVDEDDEVWTERMGGVTGRCVGWKGRDGGGNIGGNAGVNGGAAFFVGFEWRVVVFNVSCEVLGVCVPKGVGGRRTRVVQVRWVDGHEDLNKLLAISTEDGRILFYSTNPTDRAPKPPAIPSTERATNTDHDYDATAVDTASNGQHPAPIPAPAREDQKYRIPTLPLIAELNTPPTTASRPRIKDFQILRLPEPPSSTSEQRLNTSLLLVAATSTGTITLHNLPTTELVSVLRDSSTQNGTNGTNGENQEKEASRGTPKIGSALGSYETGRRIVCLDGFVMDEAQPGRDDATLDEKLEEVVPGAMEAESEDEQETEMEDARMQYEDETEEAEAEAEEEEGEQEFEGVD
ncbi:MAG: hypothetical protein M1831_006741 [Alyxoria varia]|nr:MAG: hypothetical protein M1831_006741 [Alyxoria varia]